MQFIDAYCDGSTDFIEPQPASRGRPSRNAVARGFEQFQEKCTAVFRPELRKNKKLERFRVSVKNGNALGAIAFMPTS
ncbi:hypothetical protein CYK37_02135 [Mesorhizobium loti]|nr:hypothetical protein CYK37_02135 [Mesorhizobium loti]